MKLRLKTIEKTMTNKERNFAAFVLLIMFVLVAYDVYSDFNRGSSWWHLGIEAALGVLTAFGIGYLMKDSFVLKKELALQKTQTDKLREEAAAWRSQAKKHIEGLSQSIDLQLEKWGLTNSEKEIAFLLLKGLSTKEIAEIRSTSERTVRSQATVIYAKSSLSGRSELSAYFLEDLLVPKF